MVDLHQMNRINAHAHLLPEPHEIPKFMKDKKIFWVEDDKQWMRQGESWKRPVTDPSFFVEEKLVWMEENNIDHEVLITLSQLYCNGIDCALARDVIQFQNDFNCDIQNRYPEKFTGGFVVQAAHVNDALDEIDRCVKKGMKVLCLPTHFQTHEGKWKAIADMSTEAIFAKADDHNLAIEIHPYDAPKMIKLEDEFWRFHLVWMCAQTADTYHMLTLLNFHNKYPDTRICFAHGNQFGQVNFGRRKQGYAGRPDLFEKATNPDDGLFAPNLFFDTLVHDTMSFELLKKRQGVDSILAGLDDPYPLGEMAGVENSYPGRVIDEAEAEGIINSEEKGRIWKENVIHWIHGK